MWYSLEVHRRGLTLAEVVVAIGILAVGGLAILGVFSHLMAAQSQSGYQSVARLLAQQVLEEAALAGPPEWGMTDIYSSQSRSFYLQGSPGPVTFNYRIIPTQVRNPPPSNAMGSVFQVEADVWWWDDAPGSSHLEMGKTSLSMFRIVYVEN